MLLSQCGRSRKKVCSLSSETDNSYYLLLTSWRRVEAGALLVECTATWLRAMCHSTTINKRPATAYCSTLSSKTPALTGFRRSTEHKVSACVSNRLTTDFHLSINRLFEPDHLGRCRLHTVETQTTL